ncbi:hypothetical protein JI739_11110 [Ramlibacter sp. AW1]|uniref:Uncharacterized protein n=1 Tax=Ramlibacter aurantiacus TaxID=2801330 RepID=A0A936ZP24_9BURK|nr:hypothetical protein [Ramlibacter aurantiacus]
MPPVTVSASQSPPAVEKSYRRMWRAMELFERRKGELAPEATLRFQLLPRKPGVSVDDVDLQLLGRTVAVPIAVAPDRSFTLPRHPRALAENAVVTPDRVARSMTWRARVRTPGWPAGSLRLGDLRLECEVGMEAGLVSEQPSLLGRLASVVTDGPGYCDTPDNRYIFFANRPVFGVTLHDGDRRHVLPVRRLWAGAMGDATLPQVLPFCDCEVLLDRAYFLPLGDRSWPDDTRVTFEYMEERDAKP